jgi:hypothetical protein
VRATELVVRLDQVGTEFQGFLKETTRILVHLALEIHEPEIVMRVERCLLVVVQADRLGEMFDRLTEDPLLEADVSHIDPGQRIGRLSHEHLLKGGQRLVVLLAQHLCPAEK